MKHIKTEELNKIIVPRTITIELTNEEINVFTTAIGSICLNDINSKLKNINQEYEYSKYRELYESIKKLSDFE